MNKCLFPVRYSRESDYRSTGGHSATPAKVLAIFPLHRPARAKIAISDSLFSSPSGRKNDQSFINRPVAKVGVFALPVADLSWRATA